MSRLTGDATDVDVRLSLSFAPYESKMILLAGPAAALDLEVAPEPVMRTDFEPVAAVSDFAFAADQRLDNGTSRRIELKLLAPKDWREVPELATLGDPGEYAASFTLAKLDPARRYFLQFERVCDRADVVVNGHALAPLLVPPWRCEITGLLVDGQNTLKIVVTPTLRNRLVGYANAGSRDYRQYKKQPTMPSGLIEDVTVCVLR